MKMKKTLPILLSAMTLTPILGLGGISAFADSQSNMSTTQVQQIHVKSNMDNQNSIKALSSDTIKSNNNAMNTTIKTNENGTINQSSVVPSVSAKQVEDWANEKGSDMFSVLQVIGKWAAVVIFVIAAIFAIFGSLTGGDGIAKGLWGMAVAVIMFTAIEFAPFLINFFSNWLR